MVSRRALFALPLVAVAAVMAPQATPPVAAALLTEGDRQLAAVIVLQKAEIERLTAQLALLVATTHRIAANGGRL